MGDETASNSSNNSLDLSLKEARSEFEKNYLISQIKRFNGNITKVSEFTGMERTALYRKFKSLDIKDAINSELKVKNGKYIQPSSYRHYTRFRRIRRIFKYAMVRNAKKL